LFFFLRYCLHGGDGPCDNETYVALFGFVYLEPCNASDAQVDVEPISSERDWEALTTILELETILQLKKTLM